MTLELYLRETANLAADYKHLLDSAAENIAQNNSFSKLEQNGLLHCLQIVTENAIGKAKHLLKAAGEPTPVSAYDAIQKLGRLQHWTDTEITQWNAIIGLRNRIVHEYMNIDMRLVLTLVEQKRYQIIIDFLLNETL
ncbi:hypothetical protein VT06_13100 [Arsukibacterium sp. MJ3]|uniref:type VII toxin-antitoxin system HepT family RNase toxin n=1 Tax=Arsukibacterium sp. MJ3 TaxID=1632859 RepID=UPI0006273422|nr:DUF86 domain-containing protein [Arsukibacterium sp. MJ3]KKO48174.1 hypothetical protein VT06_13100 [Arsukibacterium sp. MJ3]